MQLYKLKVCYMKTTFDIHEIEIGPTDTAIFPLIPYGKINGTFSFSNRVALPKARRKAYFKFYKVLKNDTAVTEVLTNDFNISKPAYLKIKTACTLQSAAHSAFSIPDDGFMFYGFLSRIKAMEFAKAHALKYIDKLIEGGVMSYGLLLKYREEHYEDLNINLTDRNIRKLEMDLGI